MAHLHHHHQPHHQPHHHGSSHGSEPPSLDGDLRAGLDAESALYALWLDGALADVELVTADGATVAAHKWVGRGGPPWWWVVVCWTWWWWWCVWGRLNAFRMGRWLMWSW